MESSGNGGSTASNHRCLQSAMIACNWFSYSASVAPALGCVANQPIGDDNLVHLCSPTATVRARPSMALGVQLGNAITGSLRLIRRPEYAGWVVAVAPVLHDPTVHKAEYVDS